LSYHFIVNDYWTHSAISSTEIDDVTQLVMHRMFNANL